MKASSRFTKGRKLSKRQHRAVRLNTTGSLPQALWSAEIKSIAPTRLRSLRVAMMRCIFPRSHAGVSSTTAVHLVHGPSADLCVAVPVRVLLTYMQRIFERPDLVQVFGEVWEAAQAKIDNAKCVWSTVTGPITATLATLRSIGWSARRPNLWSNSEGDIFCLDPTGGRHGCVYPVL